MRSALYASLAILLALPAAADIPKVAPEGPVWDTSAWLRLSRHGQEGEEAGPFPQRHRLPRRD